jgi:hypothetical protein
MQPFETSRQLNESAKRRILVAGAGGTGKSSFSVSASRFASDTFPEQKPVHAKDVLVFSGDVDGMRGPQDSGYMLDYVMDMSQCKSWPEYESRLAMGLNAMPKEVRVIVIDLALPFQLIKEHIAPENVKGWGDVAKLGMTFWRALNAVPHVTLIGNVQLTGAAKPTESEAAITQASAKTIGGERATYAIDAVKSLINPWKENSSFILVRKAVRERDPKTGKMSLRHWTQTQGNEEYEAKSRAKSVIAPVEPGTRTLRSLLDAAYGAKLDDV